MATLLHVDASIRGKRSLSRRHSRNFTEFWLASSPDTRVLRRDIAATPPPYVD